MNEADPLVSRIRDLLNDATSDAPSQPDMTFATALGVGMSESSNRRRPWWIIATAAALLVAVVVGLAALAGRDGPTRPTTDDTPTTITSPSVHQTWCSVLAAPTPAQIEATIRVDITGAGTCAEGFAGTLTVRNNSGDICTSDIMANLAPSGDRLWFASTSGYGGATGRWEPLPDDVIEGTGIMEYPIGIRSWPIQLPPLEPGQYTLTLASNITCATSARFEATFDVATAPDAPPPSASCATDDSQPVTPATSDATPWTHDGCVVTADVLLDRPGPRPCGFESARVIAIGWPLGTPYLSPDVPDLEYVRDPLDVFRLGVGFEQLAALPDGAIDTGYRQQNTQLWMNPTDPNSIYVVDETTIERWPLAVTPLCA